MERYGGSSLLFSSFFLSLYCARIETKNGLLIALGNVYRSANLLNLLTNQAQNDQHIIKQLKVVAWSKV